MFCRNGYTKSFWERYTAPKRARGITINEKPVASKDKSTKLPPKKAPIEFTPTEERSKSKGVYSNTLLPSTVRTSLIRITCLPPLIQKMTSFCKHSKRSYAPSLLMIHLGSRCLSLHNSISSSNIDSGNDITSCVSSSLVS